MRKEEIQRMLLEQLGLKLEDLPEPVPPTDEEVQRLVSELLDKDQAQAAADVLRQWPDQAVPALQEAFQNTTLIEHVCASEPLHRPFGLMIDVLCTSAPDWIVEQLAGLSQLPEWISTECIETAFRQSPNALASVFEQYVNREQQPFIRAALLGIRTAVWKQGFTVEREDSLYQNALRICAPDYPEQSPAEPVIASDPALFVCQAFGSLAESDLAQAPYFSLGNRHFKEFLMWLPSVVSQASFDLVRTQFATAIELCQRDTGMHYTCMLFFPLAALKLGSECRTEITQLLSHATSAMRADMVGVLTKSLAIVECGREPLAGSAEATRAGRWDALNPYEQALHLSTAFHGEVCNGGIFQFLFNSAGIRAMETLTAFELIGDIAGRELLQAGIDAVMTEDQDAPSPHAATRRLNTTFLRNKYRESLEALHSAYYQQPDFNHRSYVFVLQHIDHFRKR